MSPALATAVTDHPILLPLVTRATFWMMVPGWESYSSESVASTGRSFASVTLCYSISRRSRRYADLSPLLCVTASDRGDPAGPVGP